MVSGDGAEKKQKFDGILDDGQDSKLKSSVLKTVMKVTSGIIVAALIISIPFFFTREARVKREFKKAVKAFERKDIEKTLEFVSDDFTDNWKNNKETFQLVLPMFFNQFKEIYVRIIEMEVEFESADSATLTVDGQIIITQQDDTKGMMKPEEKVTLKLRKEKGKWRLTAAEGFNMNLEYAVQEIF